MGALAAGISAGASLLNGIVGGKSSSKAAKQQLALQQQALNQQNAQYQQSRQDFMPFLTAGTGALGQTQDLLGLNGTDPQSAAIAALKASPGFTALYDTGADTILQNAAATGGLRGGNTQNSLAQFGSGLLAQVIQQQLGNLGGLVNIGSGSAGQLGSLGANNSAAVTQILGQMGATKANNTLAQGAVFGNTVNGITGSLGNYLGGRSISGLSNMGSSLGGIW